MKGNVRLITSNKKMKTDYFYAANVDVSREFSARFTKASIWMQQAVQKANGTLVFVAKCLV